MGKVVTVSRPRGGEQHRGDPLIPNRRAWPFPPSGPDLPPFFGAASPESTPDRSPTPHGFSFVGASTGEGPRPIPLRLDPRGGGGPPVQSPTGRSWLASPLTAPSPRPEGTQLSPCIINVFPEFRVLESIPPNASFHMRPVRFLPEVEDS